MNTGHHRYARALLALSLASATGIVPLQAAAAAPSNIEGALETRIIEFSIAPQSLASALTDFAERTDLRFAYSAELTQGLRTPGVKGRMSAIEALNRLLTGTGLSFRFTGVKTLTIERAASESDARLLGPVRVEGMSSTATAGVNGSSDPTATEGSRSYTSGALSIGNKTPQSIKDTPQSVSVITAQRMQDQNINDFTQAMNQATGVTLVQGNSSLETVFYSRGFAISSIQIDGGASLATHATDTAVPGFFPQIDLAQYDHIEVLRGPAAYFNGYGDPSGTVNLVRKKPLDHAQIKWEGQLGSWNTYRTTLDASGPMGFDGRLRGRLVMGYQDNEYFYALAKDNKTLAYGVVDYDLTATTLLRGGGSFARQDSVPWVLGLPRYQSGDDLRLPRGSSLVLPWNRHDLDTTELFAEVEQSLSNGWSAKLNVTHNAQDSSRKMGYNSGTVNPQTNAGPLLTGMMQNLASEHSVAELTLSGQFELLGQRQALSAGVNYAMSDNGGYMSYAALIAGSPTNPYRPYPGGPIYCAGATPPCPVGSIALPGPPIDVFAFDPYDPRYSEPTSALPSGRYRERSQTQSGMYVNLNLAAFDRWHLITSLRYSRYESSSASENLCTSVPTTGTPGPNNCVGRRIGDAFNPTVATYDDDDFGWPPSVALSYNVTDDLSAHIGYTDIYTSQANRYGADLKPVAPITGSNVEVGLKWRKFDGALDASMALYRIEQEGFARPDASRRITEFDPVRNRDIDYYVAANGQKFEDGVVDPDHTCCYISNPNRGFLSEGVDAELTGALLPGWQIFLGYTFNRNEKVGSDFGTDELTGEGTPIVSKQPEHLLKLWTSYDVGAHGIGYEWLNRVSVSGGVNWQSSAYQAGTACTQFNPPNALGISTCAVSTPYSYTQAAYAVWSARVQYELTDKWQIAVNAENVSDTRYYQTMGTNASGNWYGEPRNFTLTLRGTF